MREQLLELIKELELLRAQATVDFDKKLETYLGWATNELHWAYRHITQYE